MQHEGQRWVVGVFDRDDIDGHDGHPGEDGAREALLASGIRLVGPAEEGDGFWVVALASDRDVWPGMDENGAGQTVFVWDRPHGGETDRVCGVCGSRRRLQCECGQWLCGPCLPTLPICFVCETNHTRD